MMEGLLFGNKPGGGFRSACFFVKRYLFAYLVNMARQRTEPTASDEKFMATIGE